MPDKGLYQVESKEEIRKIDKAGEVITYYRIWATTTKGDYFHLDVHEAELEKAPELLSARAAKLDSI